MGGSGKEDLLIMQVFAGSLFIISLLVGKNQPLFSPLLLGAPENRTMCVLQTVPEKHNEVFSHSLDVVFVENSAGTVGWIFKEIVLVIQGCLNPKLVSRQ